jgi:hypothetical protein
MIIHRGGQYIYYAVYLSQLGVEVVNGFVDDVLGIKIGYSSEMEKT